MKIKVPKEIKIGNINSVVKYIPNLRLVDGCFGSFDRRNWIMEIDPSIGNLKNSTLLHEVIHQIDYNYECGIDDTNIMRIANGLAEFLFDNLGIEFDWKDIK